MFALLHLKELRRNLFKDLALSLHRTKPTCRSTGNCDAGKQQENTFKSVNWQNYADKI